MKRIALFCLLFCILSSISYLLFSYEKNEKIKKYLQATTHQYLQNYKVLYEEHKTLSRIIFKTRINTPEVIEIFKHATEGTEQDKNEAREQLHQQLKSTYSLLKTFNIKQLHFHLPNNDSYLRFHRPKKFGDNLSNVRATIKYVNETKLPIDGFEEGRIYNGYRFVFPVFDKKRHLGSVEISFSTFAMNLEFMHDYDVTSTFLILKEVVYEKVFNEEKKNYTDSPFEDFLLEKAMLKAIEIARDIKTQQPLAQESINIINKRAQEKASFSIYDNVRKDIMSIIKVQNPITHKVVGLFIIRSSADFIFELTKHFYFILTLINFFIILILFLLYKELAYRTKIQESHQKLEASRQEVLLLNQTLEERVKHELALNRRKDQQMLQQSRLAQMGEMISMIAHQWRQPLGAISATSIDMKMKIDLETYDLDKPKERENFLTYFADSLHGIDNFVQRLSTTIDDFRNFYKIEKKSDFFNVHHPISIALKIVKPLLSSEGITISEDYDEEKKVQMYANEVVQVILNILKNAQDNFQETKTSKPHISIVSHNTSKGVEILITDNGGGIDETVMEKIFNPYFSTKEETNGSGLGLYMSSIIINEHHNAKLNAYNCKEGVCFKITLNMQINEKD